MMMTELELRTYFAACELRIIILEQQFLELRYNHNHDSKGRFTFSSGGGASSGKRVDKSGESGIINTTTTANGKTVEIVERIDVKYKPNSITQKVNKNGGIDRNYYGEDGKQYLQISNHDHGKPKAHPFGKHGEHAHDYTYDENGDLKRGKGRDLNDEERKRNGDIL